MSAHKGTVMEVFWSKPDDEQGEFHHTIPSSSNLLIIYGKYKVPR